MKKEKGFAIIEILLVVIALAILGTLVYIYVINQPNKKTESSTISTQQPAQKTKSTSKNESPKENPVTVVQNFYNEYLQSTDKSLVEIATKYGTPTFIDSISKSSGGDPVLCGQQGKTQAKISVTQKGENIVANITYPSGNNPEVTLKVTPYNGKLAIDSAVCS